MSSQFGLIGRKLSHSFSQSYFTNYFEKEGIHATYQNLEFPTEEELHAFLKNEAHHFRGFNVTLPYKETVLQWMDGITPEADAIQAVNTIKVANNRLIGHNTDAFGFHQSIKPFLTNRHEKAMIIGTGGASKAVAYVLKSIGIDVIFISRKKKGKNIFRYSDINKNMVDACKCIVQTTPLGMFPDVEQCVSFPFEFLTSEHLVIDLIYNPKETIFLKRAKEHNAQLLNGQSMLEQQALASWYFWSENVKYLK